MKALALVVVHLHHIWFCHVEYLCFFSYQTGDTPLFIASQEGHVDLVTLLVSRGADLNLAMQVST